MSRIATIRFERSQNAAESGTFVSFIQNPRVVGALTCLGIRPERQRILVVKAAIAYKAAYGPVAGTIIVLNLYLLAQTFGLA